MKTPSKILEKSDTLTLAMELLRFKSVTPVDDGIMSYLSDTLSSLGFSVDLMPRGPEENPELVQNLFATISTAATGPHIIFMGHVDVVSPGDESDWSSPPFEPTVVDGRLIGRGVVDMKVAIACFIKACEETLSDFKGTVSLLITGDEEGDAEFGIKAVIPALLQKKICPDLCIVGEPTSKKAIGDTIKHGARASSNIDIVLTGKQGHVAYHRSAINPARDMACLIARMDEIEWERRTAHFPPTNLEVTTVDIGNETVNIIPEKVVMRINVRHDPKYSAEEVLALVKAEAEGLKSHVEVRLHSHSVPYDTPPGKETKRLSEAVQKVTGALPLLTTDGGTSDARFLPNDWPVIELGLKTAKAHQVDESCDLLDIAELQEIYKELLKRM